MIKYNCFILFFIFLQDGEVNLENVTHEDAVATLKATQERVILLVGKTEPSAYLLAHPTPPPAHDLSASPQPCKYLWAGK